MDFSTLNKMIQFWHDHKWPKEQTLLLSSEHKHEWDKFLKGFSSNNASVGNGGSNRDMAVDQLRYAGYTIYFIDIDQYY